MKAFIYRLLCNRFTGGLLLFLFGRRIPDIRWKGYRFNVDLRFVNKSIIASIFWGFYESAEIRFIEKYLDPRLDVIELGASIGVVSSHILSKLHHGQRLLVVEANPLLTGLIEQNLSARKKGNASYTVLNKAIAYGTDKVYINVSDNNTESSISHELLNDQKSIFVEPATLAGIVAAANIREYALVCDIEGAEVALLQNESETLRACRQLFIELHDTNMGGTYRSVDQLRQTLQVDHQFSLVAQHGPVCYFERKH